MGTDPALNDQRMASVPSVVGARSVFSSFESCEDLEKFHPQEERWDAVGAGDDRRLRVR